MIALYVSLSPTFLNLFDNKTCTAHLLVSYYSQSSRTTHVNPPTHRNMTNFYFCAFKIINPTTTRRVKSVAQVRPRVPVIKLIDYFVDESGLSLSFADFDCPRQVVASWALCVQRVLTTDHRRILQPEGWHARLLTLLRCEVHGYLPSLQPAYFGGNYWLFLFCFHPGNCSLHENRTSNNSQYCEYLKVKTAAKSSCKRLFNQKRSQVEFYLQIISSKSAIRGCGGAQRTHFQG